jgi:tRNA (adenine22-N1)-methyltransferase
MKVPLSARLLACSNYVNPGDRVADIGCDHGYLGIHLLKTGTARSIIAADINDQPLQSARVNALKFGVLDKMQFFLSDGVRNTPRDFDTLVCCGMGGDTMISILEAAPWLRSSQYRLVLQCQSKTPMLRSYLSEKGWRITEESVLRDGKFLYTVMEVYWEPTYPRLSAAEAYFPPALMENPGEALPDYFRWVTGGLQIAVSHQNDPAKAQILAELQALAEEHPFLKEETL